MQIYSDKIFENPIEIIEASGDLKSAILRIEELRKKYFLLGYINYDFKYLYFEVFENFRKYEPSKSPKTLCSLLSPKITKGQYFDAISKIKEHLKVGNSYEVNFTYPIEVRTNLDAFDLYESLLPRQKTPYNAFLQNEKINLLSFSPELFFSIKDGKILTKPMKGTIARGVSCDDDLRLKNFLQNDEKNRAENLMIVDLMRNDLSRICAPSSVSVRKLFEIEEHPTLFQMTSEIEGILKSEVSLYDVFSAIFPCGSITGAPKISTMKIIEEVEQFERNIYCGAIGFLSPETIEFSVPIRILYGKDFCYTCHVGSGIVWDSIPQEEWEETLTKTKFLQTNFDLIETGDDDWQNHISRLKNSAKILNFKWNDELESIDFSTPTRVLLHQNGDFEIQERSLGKPKSNKVRISGTVNSNNLFLYHKVSVRDHSPSDVFDEIRLNERGEIAEGTFTNVAIQKDGKFFTPPVSSGMLNGTFRQKMIRQNLMSEKVLYPDDLKNADKIFCMNSLRKMVEVELVD